MITTLAILVPVYLAGLVLARELARLMHAENLVGDESEKRAKAGAIGLTAFLLAPVIVLLFLVLVSVRFCSWLFLPPPEKK